MRKKIFIMILCALSYAVDCNAQKIKSIDRTKQGQSTTSSQNSKKSVTGSKSEPTQTKQKTAAQNDVLSVSLSDLSFPAKGGSQTIAVTSSKSWSIEAETYSWWHLTKRDNKITVQIDANDSENVRGNYFIVKSGNLEKKISISQSGISQQDKERIEKEKFENACKQGTLGAFQEYLDQYPEGKYSSQANKMVHELQGAAYYASGELGNAYEEFVVAGGKTALEQSNRSKFDECEEYISYSALSSTNIKEMEDFLNRYPNSKYYKEVSNWITIEKSKLTGYINGHEWVDLGLSVKWATCNIGAESPYEYGDYYAWYASYYSFLNFYLHDIAMYKWGGTWRLPTEDEINELIDKCKCKWTSQGGHRGYKITGPNGNSIFMPTAGWICGTSLIDEGERGAYWSATEIKDNSDYAYGVYFYKGYFHGHWIHRRIRGTVRPVTE